LTLKVYGIENSLKLKAGFIC